MKRMRALQRISVCDFAIPTQMVAKISQFFKLDQAELKLHS